MKFIPMPDLNYLKSILHYNSDTGEFKWKINGNNQFVKIGLEAGHLNFSKKTNTWYRKITIDGIKYLAHRLAYYYVSGIDPLDKLVDHKNGNTEDNMFKNLRSATDNQNRYNSKKQKNNTSSYKGVGWYKKAEKWQARIQFNGKRKYLGLFDTKEEAYAAYCKAAEQYHKQFKNLG